MLQEELLKYGGNLSLSKVIENNQDYSLASQIMMFVALKATEQSGNVNRHYNKYYWEGYGSTIFSPNTLTSYGNGTAEIQTIGFTKLDNTLKTIGYKDGLTQFCQEENIAYDIKKDDVSKRRYFFPVAVDKESHKLPDSHDDEKLGTGYTKRTLKEIKAENPGFSDNNILAKFLYESAKKFCGKEQMLYQEFDTKSGYSMENLKTLAASQAKIDLDLKELCYTVETIFGKNTGEFFKKTGIKLVAEGHELNVKINTSQDKPVRLSRTYAGAVRSNKNMGTGDVFAQLMLQEIADKGLKFFGKDHKGTLIQSDISMCTYCLKEINKGGALIHLQTAIEALGHNNIDKFLLNKGFKQTKPAVVLNEKGTGKIDPTGAIVAVIRRSETTRNISI